MLHWVRLASVSAVLAAAVVSYGEPGTASAGSGKRFTERLPQADHDPAVDPNCKRQAWPYLSRDCIIDVVGERTRSQVRVITFEIRDEPNTSVLVRVPQTTLAAR